MPRIDLTTLIRDLALEPIPVAATIKVQARDAHGPYVSVDAKKVTFSRQRDIVLRPGQPQQIDVPPTDGTHFCWISVAVGAVEREWTLSVPDTTDVIAFGALVKVDPDTYQPTEDVLAEWDILRQDSYRARADAVAAAGVAEGHASDAAGSAGAAAGSAGSAASSAGDAAGSAGSAADSAGDAAGFAGAASESAGQASGAAGRASDSASAAAESERKAGLSASAAATSAGTADTKAGEAATSAGQAGQAKNAAEAARDLALAGQFLGSAIAAGVNLNTITTPGVYKQGTASSATLPLNYPSPSAPGVLYVTTTGTEIMQEYRPQGGSQAGRRGTYIRATTTGGASWDVWRFIPSLRTTSLAGQPAPEVALWGDGTSAEVRLAPVNVALGATNLDAVFTDGTYYQDNGANATTANNYPAVASNTAGVLRVSRRNHDNWIVQEWNPLSFTATQQSITLIRRRINSTWQAWQIVPTSLTDSSVGRRQFLVDEVNGRLNMVYGDTGRRQFVTADMLNGVTGSWTLRRNGYTVTIEGTPAPQTDIPAGSAVVFGVVPAGFRPTMVNMRQPFRTSSSTVMQGIMIASTTFEISLYAFQNYTVNQGPTPFSLTFQTVDAWPTSLPGAALGVIPVN